MNVRLCVASLVLYALVLTACSTACATTLFTTQDDFAGWPPNSGAEMTAAQVASPDLDGSTINGAGNTTDPGGAGAGGSLSVAWNSGTFNYFFSQGEQANATFMTAIGGATDSIGAGVAGEIVFDYTKPPAGNGNYFQLGVVLNYSDNFGQFFGSEVDNGDGTFTATVPYTLNPVASLGYFQLGLIYNSNFDTDTPFHVDNIRAQNVVPEPSTIALGLIAAAGCGTLAIRRPRRRRTTG